MSFTIERFPSRLAWLQARLTGIGGSDAPAIVDRRLTRWASPYSLWASKSGLVPVDDAAPQTEFQFWGSKLERSVLERFAADRGGRERIVYCRNVLWRSRARPETIYSPDAFFDDAEELISVKAVGAHRREDWADGPPLLYQVQEQHGLAVTGWQRCHFAVLLGGNDYREFTIERNDAFIGAMIGAERRFWQRVLDNDPPPVDGSDATGSVLAALYPGETPGRTVTLPPESLAIHRRRQRAIDRMAAWESMKEVATQQLQDMIGTAEIGVLPNGAGQYVWKSKTRPEKVQKAATFREFRHREGKG